jgi:predicted phosphohydrolase
MNTFKATQQSYWINGDKYGVLEEGAVLTTKEKAFVTTDLKEWLSKLGVNTEQELLDIESEKIATQNIESLKKELISRVKTLVKELLSATDYKVTRHQGQSYLVQNNELESTSLTDEEYKAFEKGRQSIRDWSNAKEIEINNATTIEELKNIDTNYENARI